jgi:glycolate oxidase iron-sulfur subunit
LTQDENESPRGRIALMRALAMGQLDATRAFTGHLERCLSCGACERVCPSRVHYGRLHDTSLDAIGYASSLSWLARRLFAAVTQPSALGRRLRLLSLTGLPRALRALPVLRNTQLGQLAAQLPAVPRQALWQARYPADPSRGDVALFLGCVARAVDPETLRSAIRVLNALGYSVHVPPGQGCCGALHQHAGDANTAHRLATTNIQAFSQDPAHPVISVASGCGMALREYGGRQGTETARQFAERVVDVNAFLARATWPKALRLAPWRARIAVHDPCSLSQPLRPAAAAQELLARIPQAELVPLAHNGTCCGAAGSYFLTQPNMAQALRADKLAAIRDAAPDVIASSNVGCALYLAAGLRATGRPLEVVHPITLVARQLPRSD